MFVLRAGAGLKLPTDPVDGMCSNLEPADNQHGQLGTLIAPVYFVLLSESPRSRAYSSWPPSWPPSGVPIDRVARRPSLRPDGGVEPLSGRSVWLAAAIVVMVEGRGRSWRLCWWNSVGQNNQLAPS